MTQPERSRTQAERSQPEPMRPRDARGMRALAHLEWIKHAPDD